MYVHIHLVLYLYLQGHPLLGMMRSYVEAYGTSGNTRTSVHWCLVKYALPSTVTQNIQCTHLEPVLSTHKSLLH